MTIALNPPEQPAFRGAVYSCLRHVLNARMGCRLGFPILEVLGCSLEELARHLEARFVDGMTWYNRGGRNGWQIDHVRPFSSFDLSDRVQLFACWHFSNLQPMWRLENIRKGARMSAYF